MSRHLWLLSWSDIRVTYPRPAWRHPIQWLRADWHNTLLRHWRDSWGQPYFIKQ